MAGLSIMGSYSGIDQSTIDALMQVEKLPLNQLTNKKTNITAEKNAWKDVNTRLNSLFERLKSLQNPDNFSSVASKSSNEDVATISAKENAALGAYNINVTQLATSTRIIGEKVGSITSGNFYIKNHDEDSINHKIEVKPTDSLQDIANSINLVTKDSESDGGTKIKGTGIIASVIDNRLVLTDEATGQRTINLSNEDEEADVLDSLGLESVTNLDKLGKNAEFTINGVVVKDRTTNSISNVVEGLTINLKRSGDSTITVSTDIEKLTKAVQAFVDQYNSTISFIEEQLAAGTVSQSGTTGRGTLAGDSSLQGLHSSLRRMVTDKLGGVGKEGNTTITDLSKLGVTTTDKSGKLSFDSSKLLKEFAKDPQNVERFFSNEVTDEKGETINIGFVEKINLKINSYISTSDGLIKSKSESFDRTLKDLNKQIDRFNDRMIRKQEYYTKMFSALDVAMMQAESQMEWLNGQISAMNAQSGFKK